MNGLPTTVHLDVGEDNESRAACGNEGLEDRRWEDGAWGYTRDPTLVNCYLCLQTGYYIAAARAHTRRQRGPNDG